MKKLVGILVALLLLFGSAQSMVIYAQDPFPAQGESLANDMVYPSQEELRAMAEHQEIMNRLRGAAADLPDRDGDGIPDDWEINGIDYDGDGIIDLPLHLMGADPDVPDIYMEIDWMEGLHDKTGMRMVNGTYVTLSEQDYLDVTAEEFRKHGINLHIDFGPESVDYVTGTKWKDYPSGSGDAGGSGGNSLPYFTEPAWPQMYTWYDTQMSPGRRPIFHYFALVVNTDVGAGGRAVVGGKYGMINYTSAFMHELGHNLYLGHGGPVQSAYDHNYKVNYFSVMNYMTRNFTPKPAVYR